MNATETAPWVEVIDSHKEWWGLQDKQITALVLAGEADFKEATAFMGARRFRKYASA